MKIHLRQIPEEGLHLEGEEDCPIPELEKDGVKCVGPLHYSLDLGISDGSLWANGRLSQPVEVSCVSCLERFVHVIEVPDFAVLTQLTGPELVDLTPFLREDILLNLPSYPHCDRDGQRVCKAPHMQVESAKIDEARKPDWSALDKLDL
ncbi:MAG: YceD family protein [Chthoniobacterales bacterium]